MIDGTPNTTSYPPVILTVELQLARLCGVLKKSRITSIYKHFSQIYLYIFIKYNYGNYSVSQVWNV